MNVNSLEIESGRTFTDNDFLAGNRAGIISQKMAEELFDKTSPLGEVVWINGQPVEIIGVLKKETGLLSFDLSEMYVPFNMMKSSFGTSDFSNVSLQVESADDIKSAGKEAAQLVNDNHGTEDSYQVMNMEEIAAGIGKVTAIMTTIIGSIAGIFPFGRRDRCHEYYARISHRTDAGNRNQKITWCDERTNSDSVFN